MTAPMRRRWSSYVFGLRKLLFEARIIDVPAVHRRGDGEATREARLAVVAAPEIRQTLLAYIDARAAVLRPKTIDKLTSALAIFGEFLSDTFPELTTTADLERHHVEAFMTFSPDGSVNGNGGCNTFGGHAMATSTGISISDVFSTRMACEPDRNAVEVAFLGVLERVTAQRVEDGRLVLLDLEGTELAQLELQAGDPNAEVAVAGPEPAVKDGATLFRDVRIFDGKSDGLSGPSNVLIEGNLIATISEEAIETGDAEVTIIEGDGRVLMPGLIDAHWHTMLIRNNPTQAIHGDVGYNAIAAADEAGDTLMRGFTAVRDVGGASFGLKQAIDEGLAEGPRIYPSGAMITVTSGHGDFRQLSELPRTIGGHMSRMEQIGGTMVADSPDEVRVRVREQLMLGASQIKLTAGAGSPRRSARSTCRPSRSRSCAPQSRRLKTGALT
jgi:heat shock protein HslJ